jgi:pyruvate dehydrogenase E1 component alpha subunit
MGPHTTSDDPTRYRSRTEEEEWRRKDPLVRLRRLLQAEGAADDRFEEGVTEAADDAAAALRTGCLAMADPEPEALFDHVYADPHPLLESERDAYLTYLADLEDEGEDEDDHAEDGLR